jgi:hypothetical protein
MAHHRRVGSKKEYQVLYSCPNKQCAELFIAYFQPPEDSRLDYWEFTTSRPTRFEERGFDKTIEQCSANFCEIYNESKAAEQDGLKHICGIGYRKALEFLIKDYLIKQWPEERHAIVKTPLGACVDRYVLDQRIKDVAKRATWLGNDETHYERLWGEMDVTNLKQMIDLTVHWIQIETLTHAALAAMPSPKT